MCSQTFKEGSGTAPWGTVAILARIRSTSRSRSRPRIWTVPPVAASWVPRMRTRVVLPAPLGPTRQKISPFRTARSTPFRASTPLRYVRRACCASVASRAISVVAQALAAVDGEDRAVDVGGERRGEEQDEVGDVLRGCRAPQG